MRQRGHGHLADLHEAAPLTKAGFPRKTERFHVCDDSFEVHVEAQLAQPVPPQGHFHSLAAPGHDLRGKGTVRGGAEGGHTSQGQDDKTRTRFNPDFTVITPGIRRNENNKSKTKVSFFKGKPGTGVLLFPRSH